MLLGVFHAQSKDEAPSHNRDKGEGEAAAPGTLQGDEEKEG